MIKGIFVYCDLCLPELRYAARRVAGDDCCEAHAVKREKWLAGQGLLKPQEPKGSGR